VIANCTHLFEGGFYRIKFIYFNVNIHQSSHFYIRVTKTPIFMVFAEWDKATHNKLKQFNLKNVKLDSVSNCF
jgi:hypothetical protein